MAEARHFGLAYGRSRAYLASHNQLLDAANSSSSPLPRRTRLMPRTRQTERIRANVQRVRRAAAAAVLESILPGGSRSRDYAGPSTSSGFDSVNSDNSAPGPSSSSTATRPPGPRTSRSSAATTASRSARLAQPRRKKKYQKKRATASGASSRRRQQQRVEEQLREVRISEVNERGELEEVVTYVRSTSSRGDGVLPAGRRRRKRKVLSDYED